MSETYRMMIYFAVATMHLYRDDISSERTDLSGFKRINQDVILRVIQEARGTFGYELSAGQMHRAIGAYLAPSQSISSSKPFAMEEDS